MCFPKLSMSYKIIHFKETCVLAEQRAGDLDGLCSLKVKLRHNI